MLNTCRSMLVKSQSCIVVFDLLLQQLYGILGQPSYVYFLRIFLFPLRTQTVCHSPHCEREQGNISFFILKLKLSFYDR